MKFTKTFLLSSTAFLFGVTTLSLFTSEKNVNVNNFLIETASADVGTPQGSSSQGVGCEGNRDEKDNDISCQGWPN